MTNTKEILLAEAKQYLESGRKVVTINGKKPTLQEWTPLRDMEISIDQVKEWLSSPLAERIAVLLDKSLLAFDYDGAGEYVIWDKLVPRCSPGLQNAFHQTTLTKTPQGGHVLFAMDPTTVHGRGIKEIQCWWNGKEHNQIILLSQNKYLVERGTGYQAVRGIDSLVQLSKVHVSELISLLQLIRSETIAIKTVVDILLPYYYNTNRDNLIFGLSGFLYKGGVEEYLINDVQEYLMDVSDTDTPRERQERFNVIKNTCAKYRNTASVSGRDKLLEAVNNDENILSTIQRAFRPLGYFRGGSSRSNTITGSTNNGDQVEERKRYEYVQKYSISDTVLAEATIIGQKAFFAVTDFAEPSEVRITLQKEIKLDDDKGTILKPLDLVAYINKPYIFKSEDYFWSYIERAKEESLDSLNEKVRTIWKKYVDADNYHITICSADTIFTHKQDRVGTTHYLFFIGDNDTGKSANLTLFDYLAYRNLSSIGTTAANIYQFLGSRDEGVGTICEDEADNIDQDSEKMRLYKSGYTKGKVVPKTDTSYGRTQYKFHAYCWKAFAAERLPDPVTAKGFLQRIVELKCAPGYPDNDISEVIDPGDDEELQSLHDELIDLRKLLFCHLRLLHYKDTIPNIKLNLRNRERQLFKPMLRVFYKTKTFSQLLPVVSKYVTQKREAKVNSYHAFLYKLIKGMIIEGKVTSGFLKSKDIWDRFLEKVDWKPIPQRPQSVDTVEFGIVSQKELNQSLKDMLGAKPPKRHGGVRSLIFDLDFLDKISRNYDIDVEVKIEEKNEARRNGTLGTLGTLRASTGLDQRTFDSADNAENNQEDDKNNMKSNTDPKENPSDKSQDHLVDSYNASHVSHVSQGQDAALAKTSEYLKNLQEAEKARASRSNSKIADEAAANLTGNGIMEHNSNNAECPD